MEEEIIVMEDQDKLLPDQRSELVNELIYDRPGFFEKWALLVFFFMLLLLGMISWIIEYPDVINAPAVLTAENAPKEIVIRQEGRLVKLLAHNNQLVKAQDVLGWIESTANHAEVISLSIQLDSSIALLDAGKPQSLSALLGHNYRNLGEIQPGYKEFIVSLQLFNDYLVNGFYSTRRTMLQKDLKTLSNTRMTIEHQRELAEKDIRLAEESYKMKKLLFEQKVVSTEEFRTDESRFYNRQMFLPQLDASLFSNESQQRDKEKELVQLDHDLAEQQLSFRQALQSLKSLVDAWKKKYVLEAPQDGRVSFIVPLQANQYLRQDKIVGYVTPEDINYYFEANLPQSNFGKIDTSLRVQLRLDAYPYQEFGILYGTLSYVSNVPSDSGFPATIRLEKGLVTNNNSSISYRNGLKGQAMIITRNMRLLERLYYNIVRSAAVRK